MAEVSRNVVAILLVVVIVVSGLGTYSLLSSNDSPQFAPTSAPTGAAVELTIAPRSQTDGAVSLNIPSGGVNG